jgi:hypothetical protein
MYSNQTIARMSEVAAAEAARKHRRPLICETEQDFHRIPNLGDYRPDGWTLEQAYFVDSSGFGRRGEPALTFDQFLEAVARHRGDGFAIIEVGQFQVYIGRFVREEG